jgi:hypothetical protein
MIENKIYFKEIYVLFTNKMLTKVLIRDGIEVNAIQY